MSQDSTWSCAACTFLNEKQSNACSICGTSRAAVVEKPAEPKKSSALTAAAKLGELDVQRIEELYGMPDAGMLASYGGGDAMQLSRQLILLPLPAKMIDSDSKRFTELKKQILKAVEAAVNDNAKIPQGKRVAHLPSLCPDLSKLQFSCKFEVSSHVWGADTFNLFYHGMLYKTICKEPGRKGAVKYPLIGLFGAEGMSVGSSEEPATIGMNTLRWADQHIHQIDGFDASWHFGSDMAKFAIKSRTQLASAWAVCVDLTGPVIWADVMLLLIAAPELEDTVEQALKSCDKLLPKAQSQSDSKESKSDTGLSLAAEQYMAKLCDALTDSLKGVLSSSVRTDLETALKMTWRAKPSSTEDPTKFKTLPVKLEMS